MDKLSLAQWTPLPWFLVSPPLLGAATLPRHRLHHLLDESVAAHPLTLVAAASGYGKTAVLASWVRGAARPVAWLTLTDDAGTADERFLGGMISAVRRIARQLPAADNEILAGLAFDPRGTDATVEHIALRCAALASPVTLVVDRAELAGPELAKGALRVLVEHCPGAFRFVLAGEPALAEWFNDLVAAGGARSIGANELALTAEEINLELAEAGAAFASNDAERILADTGGWPIAVHLARMGSQAGADTAAAEVLTEFVASSILGGLDKELSDFIMAATTCSRVDAQIARDITGNPRSAELLEQCANQGIFLQRFVGQNAETMYQWHPQFARQCRILLGRRNVDHRRELDRRAAQALSVDLPAEAISHAMTGGDPAGALHILRESWLRIIIDSGAVQLNALCLDLTAQLGQLPDILLVRACCLDAMGDGTGSSMLLAQARSAMDAARAAATPDGGRCATRAFAELFLTHDAKSLGAALDAAREAMNAHHIDAPGYAYRLFFLGWTELRLRRNPADAVRLLKSAQREAEMAGMETLGRRIRGNLMFALSYGGYFPAALALMESGDEEGRGDADRQWNHYDGAIEPFARGFTHYWQDKIPQATALFAEMVERGGHPTSYTALARVYLALCAGASGDARALRSAESQLGGISLVEQHGVPWPAYRIVAAASICAGSGDYPGALEQLSGLQHFRNVPVVMVLAAEIHRQAGRPAEAMAVLARIQGPGMVSYVAASALVTSAVISRTRGDRAVAHSQLEQALDIAAPLLIARPFNRSDDALLDLLTEHAAWGTAHEGFLAARITLGDEAVSRHEILGAQLSTREREVFGYLCTTMTAEEIAGALFVSVNTVRTHQRSIYRKLGVGTRREAIKFRP